ncbi:pantetheine-phosphate adenylyltransferase [bacterium]|nr:pantetheine-phosphate adenylyltransferase [bacterium]
MDDPIVVYPGSFDPVTYGHMDVIERGIRVFGKITVAVVSNPRKTCLFPLHDRLEMIKEATREYSSVIEFDTFEGLLVDYMIHKQANVVLRGLRALSDFDFEFEMALANRALAPNVETIFMMSSQDYIYIRATLVNEIARLGGDISHYVPPCIERRLKEYYKN